jgi:hypothetical protein
VDDFWNGLSAREKLSGILVQCIDADAIELAVPEIILRAGREGLAKRYLPLRPDNRGLQRVPRGEERRMSESVQANDYDEVPYDSLAYPQTHPGRMATVAALFGMTPAPVTHCRVLELGCAAGFNIIPMAATLPDSRFVGLDLSSRQVAEG